MLACIQKIRRRRSLRRAIKIGRVSIFCAILALVIVSGMTFVMIDTITGGVLIGLTVVAAAVGSLNFPSPRF